MPGHYVDEGEAVIDVRVGLHILTLCSPLAGKIMRSRNIGEDIGPGDIVIEVTSVGTPTWEVFVAYRRADAPGHAGRLGERLIASFGAGQVFKDIESLPPGLDFVDIIRARLQRAFVMVVIIGPRWIADQRIHDPKDLHHEEIRTALERNVTVIPVLVDGARMPSEKDLPEDIRLLARRYALEVTDTRWDYDVGRVVQTVRAALAESPRRKAFVAQVPPASTEPRWQWVVDNPEPEEKQG